MSAGVQDGSGATAPQTARRRVHGRAPHALGPRVVLLVPDVPAATRGPAGRPAGPHGGRSGLRPVPPRRAAGRGGGLPGRAAGGGRAAAAAGGQRAAIGPWYTLPDEFLVGGETLVRNLQLGLRVATSYGGAMAVGYLPDMFGHVPRCPRSWPGSASSTPWCGGACPPPVARSGLLVAGARRDHGAGRVPAPGLRQRLGAARRRQGVRGRGGRLRRGVARTSWPGRCCG
jgi:hypothetical protein